MPLVWLCWCLYAVVGRVVSCFYLVFAMLVPVWWALLSWFWLFTICLLAASGPRLLCWFVSVVLRPLFLICFSVGSCFSVLLPLCRLLSNFGRSVRLGSYTAGAFLSCYLRPRLAVAPRVNGLMCGYVLHQVLIRTIGSLPLGWTAITQFFGLPLKSLLRSDLLIFSA